MVAYCLLVSIDKVIALLWNVIYGLIEDMYTS